jgi:5-formyltetrahydrofolate cyclo-ligase
VVPSPSPNAESKAALRYEARKRRAAFVAGLVEEEREELEDRLAEVLAPLVEAANVVAAYHAVGTEIDPSAVARAGNQATTMALPAFADADALMHFRSGVSAEDGPHGIPQPPGKAKIVYPDLVLVPLLAVDAAGTRLGQGGGHYDRVLGELRSTGAKIIGLGWPMQRVEFLIPVDEWDIPLDGFASPDGLEMFVP